MPLLCADWPVRRAARLGEQVGAAQKHWRNRTPCSARRWRLGAGTSWPYGCTYRPVSCEWMYRMFGRFTCVCSSHCGCPDVWIIPSSVLEREVVSLCADRARKSVPIMCAECTPTDLAEGLLPDRLLNSIYCGRMIFQSEQRGVVDEEMEQCGDSRELSRIL